MPFINAGETVFSKYPADIQMVIQSPGGKAYIPLTSFSYDWTTEMTAEHYSGQRRAANLTQGNNDCTIKFETGFVTDNREDASYWEYLLVKHLITPYEQGSSVYFDVEFHEREYAAGADQPPKGGKVWAAFRECKLNKHGGSGSQGSLIKRTYEALCRIPAWGSEGSLQEETGGQ
jgi:hypothetical protein